MNSKPEKFLSGPANFAVYFWVTFTQALYSILPIELFFQFIRESVVWILIVLAVIVAEGFLLSLLPMGILQTLIALVVTIVNVVVVIMVKPF